VMWEARAYALYVHRAVAARPHHNPPRASGRARQIVMMGVVLGRVWGAGPGLVYPRNCATLDCAFRHE